jgi:hypothetical protein
MRAGALIYVEAIDESHSLEHYLEYKTGSNPVVCMYDLGYVFPASFFTMALVFNAKRWANLIRSFKGKHYD